MTPGTFLQFYEIHKETLYHYACTLTANAHQAEDALQNAWVACLRQEETFDALPPDRRLAWMTVVVKNAARSLWRQVQRARREHAPQWRRFSQLAACLVLAVVLVAGGAVALESAQREPVGIPSQDVTFALSGTGSTDFNSSRFRPLTENGKYLHFSFTNTAQEGANVIVKKEGWFHRLSSPARIWVGPGETVEGSCDLSDHATYWFLIQSEMGGPLSGTLHTVQSDTE